MIDMDKLANKLLEIQEPISILECRSGWRVFLRTGWDKDGEAVGKNIAYSSECNGSFIKMIETALSIARR